MTRIPALLLAFFSVLVLSACSSDSGGEQACPAEYWVATNGDDAASGSRANPFRTLERARLAVRADARRGQCTIEVHVRSGTYVLARTLTLDAGDSGSASAPVVYRAAQGDSGPVVLSGGLPVSDFTCTGADCVAPVSGLPPGARPRQLYVDGRRAVRARSNPGTAVNLDYARVPNGYRGPELAHPELVEAVTMTQWKMMRCPVASYSSGTLVMTQTCWDNANSFPIPWNFQLLSWLENAPEFLTEPNMWFYDPYAGTLRYRSATGRAPGVAIFPVLETLLSVQGQPGNVVTGVVFRGLSFAHAAWNGPNEADGYVADQSGQLLRGGGYTFSPIGHQKVVYSTPGNVQVSHASGIVFEGNRFEHLGGVGLMLGPGAQQTRVVGNRFEDIASAAIQIGGVAESDARAQPQARTSGTLIEANEIRHTGQDYYDTAGIFVGFTTGTTIQHNTLSNMPWSAISIGWGWGLFDLGGFPGLPHAAPGDWGAHTSPTVASRNRIVSNRFTAFLEKLWDGGAIYTNGAQGTSMEDGLLIQLNVAQSKRPAAGSNIYYTDGGSRFVTLDRNVSLDNPVGTVDLGPCLTGSSFPGGLCLATGLVPYGADMGGCLPVGDMVYVGNYFFNTVDFFGPQLCQNPYIPPAPVNMSFSGNVPVRSANDVPAWILQQAGRQ